MSYYKTLILSGSLAIGLSTTAFAFPNLSGCSACYTHVTDEDLTNGNLMGSDAKPQGGELGDKGVTVSLGGPAVAGAGAGPGPRGDRVPGGAGQGAGQGQAICGACGPVFGGTFLGGTANIGGGTASSPTNSNGLGQGPVGTGTKPAGGTAGDKGVSGGGGGVAGGSNAGGSSAGSAGGEHGGKTGGVL